MKKIPVALAGLTALAATTVLTAAPALAASGPLVLRNDRTICAITHGQGQNLTTQLFGDGGCGAFHTLAGPGGTTWIENANGHAVRETTGRNIELGNGSPQNSDGGAQWIIDSTGIYNANTGDYIDAPCDCVSMTVIGRLPGQGGWRFSF